MCCVLIVFVEILSLPDVLISLISSTEHRKRLQDASEGLQSYVKQLELSNADGLHDHAMVSAVSHSSNHSLTQTSLTARMLDFHSVHFAVFIPYLYFCYFILSPFDACWFAPETCSREVKKSEMQ